MRRTTLYLIGANVPEDDNLEWFVEAYTKRHAVMLWKRNVVEWLHGDPAPEPERVFIVPDRTNKPRCLQWHTDVCEDDSYEIEGDAQ